MRSPTSRARCRLGSGGALLFCAPVRRLVRCALLSQFFVTGAAIGQLSSTSAWPKLQADLQNSGRAPVIGLSADAHVAWSVRISNPIASERHATPVFSPDNQRLYVGGPGSTLTALAADNGAVLWTLMLGDGTGTIHTTPAVAADGSLYVGTWDTQAPHDGFAKIVDLGNQGEIAWTFPLRRCLASPTITPDGLIIVGAEHETLGVAYFALEDQGTQAAIVWQAGQLVPPGTPGRTTTIGATPAVDPSGDWLVGLSFITAGGRFEDCTFWQIDARTGDERARLPLGQYAYAPSPTLTNERIAFCGEGLNFNSPNPQTQGKLYAFAPDAAGVLAALDSLPLQAGHLNGGIGAYVSRGDGLGRLYVPANGNGGDGARLIAVDFDAAAPLAQPPEPAFRVAWRQSLGPAATAYLQAVVSEDEIVYVLGPSDHRLYAIRGPDARVTTLWSLALSGITRVSGWTPGARRGPQGVTVGPDGALYWNAADGYLYAISGWSTGDLDGDGALTQDDAYWLLIAATDAAQFELRFPEVDALAVGDFNGDGGLDFFDINALLAHLAAR